MREPRTGSSRAALLSGEYDAGRCVGSANRLATEDVKSGRCATASRLDSHSNPDNLLISMRFRTYDERGEGCRREATTNSEWSYAACQRRAQSHAATVPLSSSSGCHASRAQLVSRRETNRGVKQAPFVVLIGPTCLRRFRRAPSSTRRPTRTSA
jgi:hypothetical protein